MPVYQHLRLKAKHLIFQGSRDDLSVGGGVASVTRHGNSVDASFSKEVLNSITGRCVCLACLLACASDKRVSKLFDPPPHLQFSPPWQWRRATRPTLAVL